MSVYLITHGDRNFGPDPIQTQMGNGQINAMCIAIVRIPVSMVVVGTGKRFQEIYGLIGSFRGHLWRQSTPLKCSPLCGSADGLEPDGTVILTNGRLVEQENYIGIINNPAIDIWKFIEGLPDNALLCAGGELMIALGFKDINEKGHLFEIDVQARTCQKIA